MVRCATPTVKRHCCSTGLPWANASVLTRRSCAASSARSIVSGIGHVERVAIKHASLRAIEAGLRKDAVGITLNT